MRTRIIKIRISSHVQVLYRLVCNISFILGLNFLFSRPVVRFNVTLSPDICNGIVSPTCWLKSKCMLERWTADMDILHENCFPGWLKMYLCLLCVKKFKPFDSRNVCSDFITLSKPVTDLMWIIHTCFFLNVTCSFENWIRIINIEKE